MGERHCGSLKDSCDAFGKGVESGSWKLLRKKSVAAVESSKAESCQMQISNSLLLYFIHIL